MLAGALVGRVTGHSATESAVDAEGDGPGVNADGRDAVQATRRAAKRLHQTRVIR
jgi:hypothetical protein